MTKKQYIRRMKQHNNSFELLWLKIVKDTNEFIKDNPDNTMYSLNDIEKISDNITLSGPWIQDRINDMSYIDKKGLTYKVRKALGFYF